MIGDEFRDVPRKPDRFEPMIQRDGFKSQGVKRGKWVRITQCSPLHPAGIVASRKADRMRVSNNAVKIKAVQGCLRSLFDGITNLWS